MLVRGPHLEEQRVRMVTALGEELSASHVRSDSASLSDAQSVSKRSTAFRQRPGQRPHRVRLSPPGVPRHVAGRTQQRLSHLATQGLT